MAVVFLAHNGIGAGHLTRAIEICKYLADNGVKPLLLYQTKNFPIPNDILSIEIKNVNSQDANYKARLEDAINSFCLLDSPSIFIEDTHPSELNIKKAIRKLLVVRPTTFEYLLHLKAAFKDYYQHFLIADDFNSPTWPYSKLQSREIASWCQWSTIGPIFRFGNDHSDKSKTLIKKYRIIAGNSVFIFSMGGGGQHLHSNDVEIFLKKSTRIVKQLSKAEKNPRFFFVKGPLFPKHVKLPSCFEEIDVEPEMASFFALAKLAIIRPGFNTVWECLRGKTTIKPIIGTSYKEPIAARVRRINKLTSINLSNFNNSGHILESKEKTENIINNWSGKPIEGTMRYFEDTGLGIIENTLVQKRILLVVNNDLTENAQQLAILFPFLHFEIFVCVKNSVIFNKIQDSRFRSLTNENQVYSVEKFDLYIDSLDPLKIIFINIPKTLTELLCTYKTLFKDIINLHDEYFLNSNERFIKAVSDVLRQDDSHASVITKFDKISFDQRSGKKLFIRIDDVVSIDKQIDYTLRLLFDYEFCASLEVIPRLVQFDDFDLDKYNQDISKLVVSQHGYNHFIDLNNHSSIRSEFSHFQNFNSNQYQNLKRGKKLIEEKFPVRFKGGFSAPYDAMPGWLAPAWESLGGSYISTITINENFSRLASVRCPVDVWNWKRDEMFSIERLLNDIHISSCQTGYVGLVIHPARLNGESSRSTLEKLIKLIKVAGFSSASPTEFIVNQKNRTITTNTREYGS